MNKTLNAVLGLEKSGLLENAFCQQIKDTVFIQIENYNRNLRKLEKWMIRDVIFMNQDKILNHLKDSNHVEYKFN